MLCLYKYINTVKNNPLMQQNKDFSYIQLTFTIIMNPDTNYMFLFCIEIKRQY